MNKIETNVVKPEVKFIENDTDFLILTNEIESNLDGRIRSIEEFMSNNPGKGKTELEKDELYKNSQSLWVEYATCLNNSKYNFWLNRPQHKFLTDLILGKLEYDTNTVFFAIELTDMLGGMKDVKYSNDIDLVEFPVTATEITYIYHLISKHKVKGLTRDAYTFAQILRRIGNISKVFNYYDTTGKNLSTDIQDWVTAFEDGVSIQSIPVDQVTEEVTAEVLKPKKKKKISSEAGGE